MSQRDHPEGIQTDLGEARLISMQPKLQKHLPIGGKSPPSNLCLEDWLHTSPLADIYVLGFQEIVPLNAGNVLGTEDNGPAKKWLTIIRNTLNSLPGTSTNGSYQTPSPAPDPVAELNDDFEGGSSSRQRNSSFFQRHSFQSLSRSMRMDGDILPPQPRLDRRYSICDRVIFGSRPSGDFDPNYRWGGSSDDDNTNGDSPSTVFFSPMSYGYGGATAVSFQGSISISMSINQTSFCFILSG